MTGFDDSKSENPLILAISNINVQLKFNILLK